ncbi:MAG: Crp/Fnr family transcriptional regulator, partial [Pseudomonadota bacterium]
MSDPDWKEIKACCTEIRSWPAKSLISRKGEPIDRSLLLLEGFVGRHVPGPHRDLREMVALEIPGDFVDLHSFPIGTLDHDVTAMTAVRLAVFPHHRLTELVRRSSDSAMALWAQTVVDAAIHRYWAFRIGTLRAAGRVANFLCEMHSRLQAAGIATPDSFDLPLTQVDIGEACGMS